MKRIIPLIIITAAVITSVLFFINIDHKDGSFFYKLFFTILFEALFIIWFGVSIDYQNMSKQIRITFFIFVIIMCAIQFITLFYGHKLFHIHSMSKPMTTILLIESGIEIIVAFVLFAAGNLISKE
jgi:hypothetical protein